MFNKSLQMLNTSIYKSFSTKQIVKNVNENN